MTQFKEHFCAVGGVHCRAWQRWSDAFTYASDADFENNVGIEPEFAPFDPEDCAHENCRMRRSALNDFDGMDRLILSST